MLLRVGAGDGDLDRPGLRDVLHPPIDGGLWRGVRRWITTDYTGNKAALLKQTHRVTKIKDITDYGIYETIIGGCREVANDGRCKLIEVDHLWDGGAVRPRRGL